VKAVKILLAALAAVVVLLVIGAVLIASFFDPNDYKDYATDAFEARTGRTLRIEQDLTLSFFPWLAVETGAITVGNAAGFGELPFATVGHAAARVKLMPLLDRQIEIGTIVLDGVELNLARNAEGGGNWEDFIVDGDGAAAGQADPADGGATNVQSLELQGVQISNGNVYWRENTTELRYTVTGLNLETGAIGTAGGPVEVDLGLQFRNELTELTVAATLSALVQLGENGAVDARNVETQFTLNDPTNPAPLNVSATLAGIAFDPQAQTLQVEGLAAESAGIKAALQITGTQILDNPTFAGTITTAGASLAALFDLLGVAAPAGVDPRALGNIDVDAAFRFVNAPREVTVSNLEARVLGMDVSGDVALDAADTLTGSVAIPEFTPNESFFALVRPAAGADIDVSAIGKLAFSMTFDTNLSTGRATLSNVKASALGASITANLDMTPGSRGTVYRGSFATSRFAPNAALNIFGNLLPDTIAIDELGTVALDTRFVYDPGADSVTLAPLKAEAFGLNASGTVTGSALSWDPVWSGEAQIAQFSPQDLITRFGLPRQPTSDPRALTRAAIDTRFELDKDRGKFDNLVLTLDDSRISGDFTVDGFQNPRYLFTLAIDRVDADRYLPPKARDADAGEATAGDLELPENNTMRMDGRMTIGNLTLAGMSFQEVGSRILLGDGDAKLEGARARLYGGEFNGNFHVKAAGAQPGLALDGRASGLQLQPLIEALTGEDANFSGTGSFDLNLAGRGRRVIENVQTAAGNVTFSMDQGAIKGFNLGRTLCAAYNATQRAPAPPEQPVETHYEAIKGTAAVNAGTAQSSDLLARTSFMDIYGAGTLSLVEQQLNYDLDAQLTGKIEIPNCETLDAYVGNAIPFNIRGTVTSPTITPDFSKLVQRAIREEVQERLQERLQDRLRDLLR
jgi:AsmA protein